MIDLFRIVENQASLSSYRATRNEARALQLELLIEATKPKSFHTEWHPLIATPFRYNPPHPHARFRPPYGRNVFYGACIAETALYEHAFYFMKERMHLQKETETGVRTLFSVEANNHKAMNIKNHANYSEIMNRNDYTASHQFITANPDISFILYPSCRDPEQRDNAAILNIAHLEKNPTWETSIKFFYDNVKRQIIWLDCNLHIQYELLI